MPKKVLLAAVAFFLVTLAIGAYIMLTRNTGPEGETPTESENYFPFGPGSSNRPPVTEPTDEVETPNATVIPVAAVVRLTSRPSTHGIAIEKGTSTAVRFVDRAQGHISEVDLSTGVVSRVSNTTMAKIQDVLWLNAGKSLVYQYLSDRNELRSYTATITTQTSTSDTSTIKGSFLPVSLESLTASPDLKKIFFIEYLNGGSRGVVANFDGTNRKEIFSSPISEWIASWPEANTIMITTKAASGQQGFAYSLNANTGALRKVLGPGTALTTKANFGASHIAFTDNASSLFIYDVKKDTVINTGLKTFVDKCVWAKSVRSKIYCAVPQRVVSGRMPDNWYQGRVSYSDTLYEINALTGDNTPIPDYKNISSKNIDASIVSLSPNEKYLLITNKKDASLWSVNLGL
ncbi:MAG: hypothetical protein M3Q73_01130 [bacterium]|nr:hypothetical protein [bacterium]